MSSLALPGNFVVSTLMSGCSEFHFLTTSATFVMPSPSGRRCRYLMVTGPDADVAADCEALWLDDPDPSEELPQAPRTSVPATIAATEATRRVRRVIMSTLFLERRDAESPHPRDVDRRVVETALDPPQTSCTRVHYGMPPHSDK